MQIHELNTFNGVPGDNDFLAIDNGFDTAKISADKLYAKKVNQPLDETNLPVNGNDGDFLRAKGNGKTYWAAAGLPTDEQTAQAVSDWLDTHPEATTTVLDGSITEAKLDAALKVKAIKEYVTPEMFGAVGDGTTDDSAAFASAIASGKAVICDYSKVYKADINVDQSYTYIQNLKLKGEITFDGGLQFVTFFNCNIDATGKNYGFYTEVNVTKLRLIAVHVHDATIDNIHLYKCWDAALINVSATGAGNNNFDLRQFNNGYLLGTSYYAKNFGIRLFESTGCTVMATIQECEKTGVSIDNILGSLFRVYLEQNGYNGTDDYEKSQMVVGKTSRCVGNNIVFYAIGGAGSDMESKHGLFLVYSDDNTYEGFAESHLANGFRCGSNARGNSYHVVDKTHTDKTYDIVSCRIQHYGVTAPTPNSLITIDASPEFFYIPVIRGNVAYMVSFDKRSNTQAVVRVTDHDGNNQNPSIELHQFSTGIKTA